MDKTVAELRDTLEQTGTLDAALQLKRAMNRKELSDPKQVTVKGVPVTIVAGPPGSGKTTYAKKNAGSKDLIVDLDDIKAEISKGNPHRTDDQWSVAALKHRNKILNNLKPDDYDRVWLVVGAPSEARRDEWKYQTNADNTVVMDTSQAQCNANIDADSSRVGSKAQHKEWVSQWFERDSYTGE